jgi:hypothetical protein
MASQDQVQVNLRLTVGHSISRPLGSEHLLGLMNKFKSLTCYEVSSLRRGLVNRTHLGVSSIVAPMLTASYHETLRNSLCCLVDLAVEKLIGCKICY